MYKAPPMGPLVTGDSIDNGASITGGVVSNNDINSISTGTVLHEGVISLGLEVPQIIKSVYAVNGSLSLPNPLRIMPGDLVTFRLRYNIPTGDYKSVKITDTLPLPTYEAETLTNLSFNNINTGIPATGNAQFGPANSGAPLVDVPGITISNSLFNNQITFSFPDKSDVTNTPTVIDILFTLTAQGDPFVDPLMFTNQVNTITKNTAGQSILGVGILPLETAGPRLRVKKGVVATNNSNGLLLPAPVLPANVAVNPAGVCSGRLTGTGLPVTSSTIGSAFNANVSNVDAADQITYAVVIENLGSSSKGAFDVSLSDTIPAGTTLVGGSLCVNDGAGNPIAFTGSFPGSITLTDPGPNQGALGQGQNALGVPSATGTNIAIITYTVTNDLTVTPRQTLTNTATLTNYAAIEGGPNFTPLTAAADLTDTASVTIADPLSAKALAGTEIDYTLSNPSNPNKTTQAVIGELLTYQLRVTVPEGVMNNVSIADTLDAGLAFVDVTSVTVSSGDVNYTNPITIGPASPSPNPTVGANGTSATFNLGTVTNSNTNNAVAETITITYRAVVLNTAINQAGQLRNNSAVLSFTGGTLPAVSAPDITIIESQVGTTKDGEHQRRS